MKKKIFIDFIILTLISITFILSSDVSAKTINIPLFYGASKIELDKNVIDNDTFDITDSRFRIFARDYEDGDLTPYITCSYNNVVPNTPGNYKISYSVKDSDNNEVSLDVDVIINDSDQGNIKVRRTIYAIPQMANMKNIGMERCNNGDRQILGIYLKENCSFTLTALDDISKKTEITFFTDTRKKNSFSYINANDKTTKSITNVNSGVSYDAVPFITSIRLDTEDIDVTYNYELAYNMNDALPLDYYHYKDNEETFYNDWNTSQNKYAVVDGEAMMMVVPIGDINNLNKTFKTLDKVLEYYLEVVNRMDKMVGLSFNPTNEYDRNYRTKYIAVCDSGYTAAGAYYMGTYIAVCSSSIYGFFTFGWGSLHEIAHGYQGYFGKGVGGENGESLYLNETGNNVLAYYIQTDKTLYLDSGLWLGEFKNIEESLNEKRLAKTPIFNNDGGTYTNVREKLYFILNLLNSFEGSETYGKLFSYYRSIYQEYANKYTIIEIYAMFFKEYYNVNILEYIYSWGLNVSDEVAKSILEDELKSYYIKSDYMTSDDIPSDELKYSLICEDDIKVKKKGALVINLDSSLALNKVIGIKQNGKLINYIKIENDIITINDLEYGNYELIFPQIIDYSSNEIKYVSIMNELTNITFNYEKIDIDFDPNMQLWIRGVYQTVGFRLTLSNHNKTGAIELGGANLGNQTNYWKNNPDLTFISIQIVDNQSNVIKEYIVKGNNYFNTLGGNESINLDYGYKVIINTEKPEYVNMWYQGNKLAEYDTKDKTITYEITSDGFKLLNNEAVNTSEILYNINKETWISKINEYKNSVTEDELNNRNLNTTVKQKILSYYNYLSDNDKVEFDDLIQKIKQGGSPTITLKNNVFEYEVGSAIDLLSYIEVYDNEDYYMTNYKIDTNLDSNKEGNYTVNYIVTDSDNNEVKKTINIVIKNTKKDDESKKEDSDINDNEVSSNFSWYIVLGISLTIFGVVFILFGIFYFIRSKKINKI